jgi:hypothetical protein
VLLVLLFPSCRQAGQRNLVCDLPPRPAPLFSVTGSVLLRLTDEHLVRDLGVLSLGQRQALLECIKVGRRADRGRGRSGGRGRWSKSQGWCKTKWLRSCAGDLGNDKRLSADGTACFGREKTTAYPVCTLPIALLLGAGNVQAGGAGRGGEQRRCKPTA